MASPTAEDVALLDAPDEELHEQAEVKDEEPAKNGAKEDEDAELELEAETATSGHHGEENLLDDLLHQHNEADNIFDEEDKREDGPRSDNVDGEDISDDDFQHDDDGKADAPKKEDEDHSDISDSDSDDGLNKEDESKNADDTAEIKKEDENMKTEDAAKEEKPEPDAKPVIKREKIEAPKFEDDNQEGDDDDAKKDGDADVGDEEEDKKPKKKGKSYDYATKLNYLFRDARFFLVKSNNAENVSLSKAKGVWSTPPANESRFNQAFSEARNVILIFSVKESGKFAGIARMATGSSRDGPTVNWVLPPGMEPLINKLKACYIIHDFSFPRFVSKSPGRSLPTGLGMSQGALLPEGPASLQRLERLQANQNRPRRARN